MTLDELTTPYERRRVIEYGRAGSKVVRHWYEVQQVDGAIYKTRDFPDEYGAPQFKLCIFFDGAGDGLVWQWMGNPEHWTVEGMSNSAKRYCVDRLQAMLSDLFSRMNAGRFIGGTEIEFIRQFDPGSAEIFAEYRADYYAKREEQDRQKRLALQAEEEAEKARLQAEQDAVKAKYFGWADALTPLQFGKARARLEGLIRSDGKVMQARDLVLSLVKDGWAPVKAEGVVTRYHGRQSKPRTEYRLTKDGYFYKVNKTAYDFALYLSEHMEQVL